MNGLTRFPLSPTVPLTFSLLLSSPREAIFFPLLQCRELSPLGAVGASLRQPMSMATVPVPPPNHLLSSSAPSHQNQDDPTSVHLPPLYPDPPSKNPRPTPDRPSVQISSSDPPPPPRSGHTSSSSSARPPVARSEQLLPPPDPFPPLPSAPHPLPSPDPSLVTLSSAAATSVAPLSFPIPTPSIFATPSSSVFPSPLGAPVTSAAPSTAPPPSSLALSSATTSVVSTSSNPLLPNPPLPATPLPPLLIPSPSPAAPPQGHGFPPPKSYAQVARTSRGSGFVRSHASDVESFARLPRTGINIICGSKEGIPSFSFANSDLLAVENLYSNALIMKFHGGRPSLEASFREIQSWGLESPFSIGPLTSRAFLLRFQNNKDLIRVLSRPTSIIISFPYKVFRWHNLCHQLEDSCFAPVWISLPRLPLQCFIPEFLESVANQIGRFLCLDIATSTLASPSAARLCVEIDLRKPPPPFIWVGLFEGYKQPVIYEKLPKFCSLCIAQGHLAVVCPTGHREASFKQTDPIHSSIRGRTPPVRLSATKQSSSNPDQQYAPSASIQCPTTTPPPPPPHNPAPYDTYAQIPAPSSAAEAVDQPSPSHRDSLHSNISAAMSIHPQPIPRPKVSLDGSSSPSVAYQSSDRHVHQPPVKQPSSYPKQQQSVALVLQHASSTQQISSLVAAPPPPPQLSSICLSSVVHHPINSSPIHLQTQPSAAMSQRSPAATVPSTSHATPQSTLTLPVAALSAGSSLQPAAALFQGPFFPSASPASHFPYPTPHPPPSEVPSPVLSLIACANANGLSSQVGAPLVSPSLAVPPLLSQQYNLEANQGFWNVVSRQVALNEQARHKIPSADASSSPSAIHSLQNFTPSAITAATQSSPYGDVSGSSDAADSQPNSPSSPTLGALNPYTSVQKLSYASEGEEPMSEPTYFQGHNTDDMLWQRPRTSKRNKRHPDQPLKVQLRARKTRNPQPAC